MIFQRTFFILMATYFCLSCDTHSISPGLVEPSQSHSNQIASADITQGFEFLVHGKYGSQTLNDDLFDNLWQVWDGDDGEKASAATFAERRAIAYTRYGFFEAPYENNGLPMGYTKGDDGQWFSNCLLCHAGKVNGHSYVGAPNNRLDLATLNEDVRLLLSRFGEPVDMLEHPSTQMSTSIGLTNAVVFSHELLSYRDIHLNLSDPVNLGPVINHDLDAPPWWHIKNKSHFYSDAFVPKNPRALMQFAMDPDNDGATLRDMLPHFERILKYLETIESPNYFGAVNSDLALRGKQVFEMRCSLCHGSYAENGLYPNRLISKDVVQTDNTRLYGLTREFREYYALSWLSDYGAIGVSLEGIGYVAPPLHGIWASAPYMHNGSIPTLYDVLSPNTRPTIWKVRDYETMDIKKVGLLVDDFISIPASLAPSAQRRYYDTTKFGKSNQGHTFGSGLTEDDKFAVIEYLKTL